MAISADGVPAAATNGTTLPPKHEDDASHMLHRSFNAAPINATSTSAHTITLANGTPILDACGGAAVACLGYHSQYITEITAAITAQLASVPYIHTLSYTTTTSEELATHLLSNEAAKAAGLQKAYFIGSGSEAMDAALKFARQYWFEKGERQRVWFVSRRQSYHGNTVGAMGVSCNVPRKAPYVDEGCLQLKNVSHVGAAYYYQYGREGESEGEFAERLVREVEEEFLRVGPERVVAFVAEPVVGATSGCVPAPKGYFEGVRRVCDKYGVLLILDEVMCGMGRTGSLFAFEQEGVRPDLLTMGKCLGAGFAPIAAVLVGEKVVEGLRGGSGNVAHGHTYQAHPVSCAAALAVQKIIKRENLVEKCREMGSVLERLLRQELDGRKYVGNVRGRGLLWGVEFVKDKKTKEPFPADMAFGPRFQTRVFEKGVAVYPGAGTVDGAKGDHAIVSPAYTVTEEELRTIVRIMKEVYEEMEKEVDGGVNVTLKGRQMF